MNRSCERLFLSLTEARSTAASRRAPSRASRWRVWEAFGTLILLGGPGLLGLPAPAHSAVPAAVRAALEAQVRTLSRPVYTYHYVTRGRMGLPLEGYVAPNDPRLGPYLESKVARFWDLRAPLHPGATIGGLYVATDPIAGRSFGGGAGTDYWVLVELVLEPGFRFLDVRDGGWQGARLDERRWPEAARQALAAAGCEVAFPSELVLLLESQACREIAVAALAEFQVDGILYSWNRFEFPGTCPNRADGAFILVRSNSLRSAASRLLTKVAGPQDGATEDRRRVQALVVRARSEGSTRELPWPQLAGLPEPPEMEAWIRQSLFGCGGFAEDHSPPAATADSNGSVPAADHPTGSTTPDVLYHEAKTLLEAKRYPAAAAKYREVLAHEPEYVLALDDLAWLIATHLELGLGTPEEAVEMAELLVRLTHYGQRQATVGLDWSKAFKVRCAHTLAVSRAAAESFPRAVDYGQWSVQISRKLEQDRHTPETARLLAESEALLALFRAGQKFSPAPDFERLDVPLYEE